MVKKKGKAARRPSPTVKLAAEKVSVSEAKTAPPKTPIRRDSLLSQRSATTYQSKSYRSTTATRKNDNQRFIRKVSLPDSRGGTPTGLKRSSCFGRRSRKVRVVSEAVAINRIQRWFRRMALVKHMAAPGQFLEILSAQKTQDERLEEIRARLAKLALKHFFNRISAAGGGTGSPPRGAIAAHRDRVRHERAKKTNIDILGDIPVEYVEVLEAAILAKRSMQEAHQREAKKQRRAVRIITTFWMRTKLYKYLRQLSNNKLAQRIVCQQEVIERRDIIRRYYKDFIQYHQDCFNDPLLLDNGQGTRTIPLYISLILFSSDCSLEEIMDDVKKPYGVGPYHPYSVEHIPEDFKTLRMLERRFMFSKEERQLLQEEGILDVNEPPRPDPSYFDPDFVFGSVLDYLRPGEFSDKYRNNHPSLQLGIRRTSSLILDRDFRIIGENGEAEEGKHAKPLPSARALRRSFAILHQFMKKLGFLKTSEIDGTYNPSARHNETWSMDPLDLEEDPRERKLHNDLLLILRPQLHNHLHVHHRSHTIPIVQEQLALTQCRGLTDSTHASALVDGSGSVANAFLHPSLKSSHSSTRLPNQDPTQREKRASGVGAAAASPMSQGTNKALDSKHAPAKIEGADKVKLFKYLSSSRSLGSTWKTFIEETNFSASRKRPPSHLGFEDSVLGTTRDCFSMELASRSEMTRATFTDRFYPDPAALASARTHKHLSMVLGNPEERQELSLQHFLSASKRKTHDTEAEVLGPHDSRGISQEPNDADRCDTMSDTSRGRIVFSQLLDRTPFVGKPPPPSVSPFIADPRRIMYLDLQSEFERLAVQENRFRHQLYLRFMLLSESITSMCRIEAERKKEFFLKLLDVEA